MVIIKFFFLAFSRFVVLVCGPSSRLEAFLEVNFSLPSLPSAACCIRSSLSCLAFLRGPRMVEASRYSSFVDSTPLRLGVSDLAMRGRELFRGFSSWTVDNGFSSELIEFSEIGGCKNLR